MEKSYVGTDNIVVQTHEDIIHTSLLDNVQVTANLDGDKVHKATTSQVLIATETN
jgi:hypothetical protein